MVELNYMKLQKHLSDLVKIKGEKPAHITQNSGVWNIKKMMEGENEPTLNSWCKLHEAYPKDIPEPEYLDGAKVYKNVSTGKNAYSGDHMEINNNRLPSDLSPEEQTLINLLRKKDTRGKILERIIPDLIMRETEDDKVI